MPLLRARLSEQLHKIQTEQSVKTYNPVANEERIVPDGTIITSCRDPPGQHRVYIKPGDLRRELYRLTTFEKFPEHSPVNPCQFAAQGFFYTGYKDRVKCFSCAQTVESWTLEHDPLSSKWHEMDCQFVQGTFYTNIPFLTTWTRLRSNNISTGSVTATQKSNNTGKTNNPS